MPAARYVVRGLVQGVGFRWFVHRQAARLGLRGFVRNLADGSVEVVADGPADAIERLEQALQHGPSMASVTSVEKADVPHELKLPNTFEIN